MTHRYGNVWDAVECAAHDFLAAVDKHCREHRVRGGGGLPAGPGASPLAHLSACLLPLTQHIQLFALLLAQELPTATFRYALTLTDVVYSLPWRTARDFELLAKVLYPFLEVSWSRRAIAHDTIYSLL